MLESQIELDISGYILVEEGTAKTSPEGAFAVGDVQDHEWSQAITAPGSGCVASLSVERYLTSKNLLIEFHQQPQTEEVKKNLLRYVEEGFNITLTKHNGQYALQKLYHESLRNLCVLYTSPTCGLCRTLKPILSKLVQQVVDEFDQHVHFIKIDITEDPKIAEAARIMGTPCVQFLKNKEMLRKLVGDPNLYFMESPALDPPKVQTEIHLQKIHEQELAVAAAQPLPDDDDDVFE